MGYFNSKNTKCVDEIFDRLLKSNPLIRLQLVDNICERISVCLKVKAEKGFDKVFLRSDNITSMDIRFIDLLENKALLKSGCIIMVDTDSEASNEGISYLVGKLKIDSLYQCIGAIYAYNQKRSMESLKNVVNTIEENISSLEYNQINTLRCLIDRNIMGVATNPEVINDLIEVLNKYLPNSSWNISSKKRNMFE